VRKLIFCTNREPGKLPETFVARAMELKKILGDAALEDFSVHNTSVKTEPAKGTAESDSVRHCKNGSPAIS